MKRRYTALSAAWISNLSQVTVLTAALLLSACGGGDGGDTSSPPLGSSPPASSNPTPDTTPPTVTASVSVSSNTVTLIATATDNVGVSSVSYDVDNGTIKGSLTKTPNDGTFSLPITINFFGKGSHTMSASAVDAAGNTATSAVVTFTVGDPATDGPDTTAPTVTAAVEGNFGLVKVTAIAKDDRRIDTVSFLIDGVPLGFSGTAAYLNSDPADQFFRKYDTTKLADGPHTLVARASDRANNVTNSDPVTFTVDSTAGLIETDPNDTIATATPVLRPLLQISGNLNNIKTDLGGGIITVKADADYYQISLAAAETLSVNMLSPQGFTLSVVDVDGTALAQGDLILSDVKNVTYTNGATARDVYISISSAPIELAETQYKLGLTYR